MVRTVISKSEYMMFLKHPAWLWLKKHDKTKLPIVDDNTQAIFDAGNLFETYAEQLFPDGVRLGFDNYNEYLNLPERTQKALHDGVTTIFQGRFEVDEITCIVDVIQRVGDNEFDLFEIKATNEVKTEHKSDLAFQTVVIERTGLEIRDIYVVHADGDYKKNGEIDITKLVSKTNITDAIRKLIPKTAIAINEAVAVANSSTMPDPSPRYAGHGGYKEWSTIFRLLRPDIEPFSIYDLASNIGSGHAKKIGMLEDLGIRLIADIPDNFKLQKHQVLQRNVTRANKPFIDVSAIKDFVSKLVFPLYFLDYETFRSVVPVFDGNWPYQQVPFQYSIHRLNSIGGELSHFEYLHTEKSDTILPLLKQLKSDIGETGTVLVWYEGFEKLRNEEMGQIYPTYEDAMTQLNARVIDLMTPFAEGMYADKRFLGSASIKKVLPVLVPELSYKELGIQEGGSASRLWAEAVLEGKRDNEKEQILSDLIEYCGLDTLAMVEIYEVLRKL